MPGTTVVNATIIGLEPDHVRVTERRYPNSEAEPVVMIELGGTDAGTITIPGRLETLELVAAEIARGLVQLGQARGLG
jgi:hypothetical protein